MRSNRPDSNSSADLRGHWGRISKRWTPRAENRPFRLILCAEKDEAVARYALEGLPNKVLAREDKLALPDEKLLAAEIEKTRKLLERQPANEPTFKY